MPDERSASYFLLEFDSRDFSARGAPYKEVLKEMDEYLSKEFKVTVTKEGFGESISKGAFV